MSIFQDLQPERVFHYFEELSAIPRGSGSTAAAAGYCEDFARARGLECRRDAANNVVIVCPATPGYEAADSVMLQGHLDMVCEKEPGCGLDMERQGLELFRDGDLVGARGTTLGADDGIAVAMVLAILEADDLPHPRLEAVFTSDEEVGMLGAAALDMSGLTSRRMLNLDSEDEGIFIVSCAGGCVCTCVLPLTREPFAGTALRVTVSGLTGGHSGGEINKGRGNSNMLMGRVLRAMEQATPLRIVSVSGGKKDNAIPRETAAVVIAADSDAALAAAERMGTVLAAEYAAADPALFVRGETCEAGELPMTETAGRNAVCMLTCLPNGVQAMSADLPGLVETSLNLGILKTERDALRAVFCVRSSVESRKRMLLDRLDCMMERLGGSTERSGDYPGWPYRRDSALRDLMAEVFTGQYGRAPKLEAIHAGVECGLFCGALPGLDCVSIGPDLMEIHTPRERMSISSVQRVWTFTCEVLRRCR